VLLDPELDSEDNIRREVDMVNHVGWDVRRQRIMNLFTEWSGKLSLGLISDDKERERAVGRCQALKQILDMDQQVLSCFAEMTREEEPERLEGGDFPLSYEAAQ